MAGTLRSISAGENYRVRNFIPYIGHRMRCVGHVARNQTVTSDSYIISGLQTQTNTEIRNFGLDRIPGCTLWVFVCSGVVWRFGGTHCNRFQGRCNDNMLEWFKPARAKREEGPLSKREERPLSKREEGPLSKLSAAAKIIHMEWHTRWPSGNI